MSDLSSLINNSATVGNPIDALRIFLEKEASLELARQVDSMRFAGYVLELGYDTAKIITSDKYKLAVGGIPRAGHPAWGILSNCTQDGTRLLGRLLSRCYTSSPLTTFTRVILVASGKSLFNTQLINPESV